MPSRAGPTGADGRLAILASSALLTLLAWAFVIHVARSPGMSANRMMDMPGMEMPSTGFVELFAMWVAMMVGMMLPSVLPSVLLYARMARQRRESGRPPLPVAVFVSGYLLAWVGFSLAATLLQTRLHSALLPLAAESRAAAMGAGILLVVTGVYQWTRYKAVCLSHCRSPLGHFSAHWREGAAGALRMGAEHGLLCMGCCWLLMALLFVGGVMNPWWIAGLALLVLVEKVTPRGDLVGRLAGVGLALWGLLLLFRA
jgi:predicted metal-binding membrane protein